jgi:hypothetical protein
MTTETTDPSLPVYYAYKCVRGHDGVVSYLIASPDIRFVKIHGFSQPIVTLRIRERRDGDPPSGYFGWLATDRPGEYQHVWPSEGQLEMCFPYGSKIREEIGYGRKVNLIVEEVVA